jgi:hypothetical protein
MIAPLNFIWALRKLFNIRRLSFFGADVNAVVA